MTKSVSKPRRKSQFEGFRDSLDGFLHEVRQSAFDEKSAEAEDTQEDSQENTQQDTQEDIRAGKRTPKRTVERTSGHPRGHSRGQSGGQEDRQSRGHPEEHPKGQPTEHSRGHSENLIEDEQIKDPVFWLQDNYAKVLDYLISKQSRVTKLKDISDDTQTPYGTVRKAIKCLTDNGFITKPRPYHKGKIRGITYSINEPVCGRYLAERRGHPTEHPREHSTEHSREQSSERTPNRTLKGTPNYISSSSLLDKTTTNSALNPVQSELETNPELGYWRQKELSAKQVQEWIGVAECSPETMIQYLCYCRFDMVDLDQEKTKPVDNVFNWFFRIIERTGGYPRPKGYKSFQDKQIEAERQFIAEQRQKAEELKKLQREKWKAVQDTEFWQMMNDPDGELYKQCFDRLNTFEKRLSLKGGKAFEVSMRAAFGKVMEDRNPPKT